MNCRQHLANVATFSDGRESVLICNAPLTDGVCPQMDAHADYTLTPNGNRWYPRLFRWQLGHAITLPIGSKTVVFFKSGSNMPDAMINHEMVHVDQLARMGALRYLWTHLWARLVTRNIWGRGHWIEEEAYAASVEG